MQIIEKNFAIPVKGAKYNISTYFRSGNEYILFLHGIQSNKELFKQIINQDFLVNYGIIVPDLIGFGMSSKPGDFSYNIEDQVQIILALLDQLQIKKLHIIGHSLGGIIGTLLLKEIPEKIISFLNFEGNLTLKDTGFTKIVANSTFTEFKENIYPDLLRKLRNSNGTASDFREKWLETIPDFVFYKTSLSIVKTAENEICLKYFIEAKCKKAYVIGEKNIFKKEILPENIKTFIIPNAGHFMLLENMKECIEVLKRFF